MDDGLGGGDSVAQVGYTGTRIDDNNRSVRESALGLASCQRAVVL